MYTFEVAFLVNGVKQLVPVTAEGFNAEGESLELFVFDKEGEADVVSMFKDWIYVTRIRETCSSLYADPQFAKAQIQSVKRKTPGTVPRAEDKQ